LQSAVRYFGRFALAVGSTNKWDGGAARTQQQPKREHTARERHIGNAAFITTTDSIQPAVVSSVTAVGYSTRVEL